jgi:DNA-binding PadR family transcriptional regulator
LLEEQWDPSPVQGKPPRHMYRLTAKGRAEVQVLLRAQKQSAALSLPATLAEGGAT